MEEHFCLHETEFKQLAVDVAEIKGNLKTLDIRINGSLEKINAFMESGKMWRMAILGMALTIVGWVFLAGSAWKQIEINTNRLNKLEATSYVNVRHS